MTRRPFVAGNWKMFTERDEAVALARACASLAAEVGGACEVGIAPPAIWAGWIAPVIADTPLRLLGQNASEHAKGAFTGEIAPPMLRAAGAAGVILGHSERRQIFGETNAGIGRKVVAARAAGLQVILCAGETLDERKAGRTLDVVRAQLEEGLPRPLDADGITIAYEPVWAIGTGVNATPEQAQEVHAEIRGWLGHRFGVDAALAVRIQYGGSVKPENAAAILRQPDVDGALVGGASLSPTSFGEIVRVAAIRSASA